MEYFACKFEFYLNSIILSFLINKLISKPVKIRIKITNFSHQLLSIFQPKSKRKQIVERDENRGCSPESQLTEEVILIYVVLAR